MLILSHESWLKNMKKKYTKKVFEGGIELKIVSEYEDCLDHSAMGFLTISLIDNVLIRSDTADSPYRSYISEN